MAEPEELVIEGAHAATRVARAIWKKYGPPTRHDGIALADVRPRLELFATALFSRPIAIAAMAPPPPVTFLARLAGAKPHRRGDLRLLSGTDGARVYLPEFCSGLATYHLLTVQQSARLSRGTADVAARLAGSPARDWFLLAEAALVDGWIATEVRGLAPALAAVRAAALRERVKRRPDAGDDPFEQALRALLAADSAAPPLGLDAGAAAGDAAAWAAARSSGLGGAAGRERYLPWYWGLPFPPAAKSTASGPSLPYDSPERARHQARVAEMRRRPRPREAAPDEDDAGAGTWVIRADEPQESVEDPYGLQRPADRDDHADPDGLADSLSDLPEARIVRTPGQAREILRSGEETPRAAREEPAVPAPRALAYPEWDYRAGCYRVPGAIVREPAPALGDPAWVAAALARHGRLVRRVRSRFERLRPRDVMLGRQPDGPEVDIDAFVTTAADLRAGTPVDGRMYVARRPARRELSVALLVDVSASTDSWVANHRRVVDVEKEALLVVCEALDALGDRYGIFSFSGEGPERVTVTSIKSFGERSSLVVRRRIAALDSEHYTRMGAAVRHVTSALGRERTDRRLLLILSDGKPNDVDIYEGRYGVEDTRQAIAEARRQGVAVFCLTVDREAPRYAPRLFGRAGFAVLRRPDQLPSVLIEALRQLLRS